jgi:antitoxin (DNA-binding transcriptional repressor) of toxin-antitoxin stability system
MSVLIEETIMLTKTVDVSDSQARFAELLALALSGTEIVFTQNQLPLARLVPIASPRATPRVAGLHKGAIWTSDDFDEPLPEDFWTGSK